MAYSSGSLILDDDYNIFATGNAAGTGDNNTNNVNTIWGTGTGDKGYGQSGPVSAVSAGATITATQWSTLLNRMTTIANHQGTSLTSITNPNAGNTIEAFAALSSNLSSIWGSRLDAAGNGADITSNGTVTTTSSWDVQAATSKTFTFASADAARYFFNAGGQIRMSFSRTGGTSSDKNTGWSTLLSNVGTLVFTGYGTSKTIDSVAYTGLTKIGGGGTTSVFDSSTGVLEMGSGSTERFKQFASTYLYTANYVSISTAWSGTVLTVSVTLRDDAADEIAPAGTTGNNLDVVDGTLTMSALIRPPSTTYLSNTWGTPSMGASSWSLTS